MHHVHEKKVPAVNVWTPGTRYKRNLKKDYPLWISAHRTTWTPNFQTKIKTKKQERIAEAKISPGTQIRKADRIATRLKMSTLYARTKDSLDEARKEYDCAQKYTPHCIKHLTASK